MFEFFVGIKHFQKHKQHTSKDAEFIALHDYGQFCSQIQMLQYIKPQDSATVCIQEQTAVVFEFFVGIKHFQKHKQYTSKDAEFIALHDHGQFCNQIQMLQYIKRQDSAPVCRHEQTA